MLVDFVDEGEGMGDDGTVGKVNIDGVGFDAGTAGKLPWNP